MPNLSDALLVLKNRPVTGGTGAYRLTAGTNLLQIGTDFGAAEAANRGDMSRTGPRIVQFRGPNDLYAVLGASIYKYDGVSTWSVVDTLPGLVNNSVFGLFVTHPNGVPTLVVIYAASANNRVRRSTDGTTWTAGANTTLGFTTSNVHFATAQFRDRIYARIAAIASDETVEYNTVTDSWVAYSAQVMVGAAFHVYNNELYMVGNTSSTAGSQNTRLRRLQGGSWPNIQSLSPPLEMGSGPSGNGSQAHGHVMFTDPGTGDLIVFHVGGHTTLSPSGLGGTGVLRLTPSGSTFTVTDITTTVIPAGFRPGDVTDARAQWFVFRATDGSIHLWYVNDTITGASPNGFVRYAPWNGVSTLVGEPAGSFQNLSPFANAEYIFPWHVGGGGEHVWTLNEATIQLENVSGSEIDKKTLRFRVYGDGVTTYSVKFEFSTNEDFPSTPVTLNASTVTGAGSPTNTTAQVNGVVSNGALYTVEWDVPTDGVLSGSFYTIKAVEA